MTRRGYRYGGSARARRKILKMMRRYRHVLIIAAAVAAALLLIFFVIVPAATPEGANPADGQPLPDETAMQENVDEQTLAGLTGSDSSLFSDGDFAAAGQNVGISVLDMSSDDAVMMAELEKLCAKATEEKQIEEFFVYDAKGNQNQQIQDVLTMLNKGAKVLIVAGTDDYNFTKIAEMAAKNDVPIVGYNLSADSGFALNIVNNSASAEVFGQFMKAGGITSVALTSASDAQAQTVSKYVTVTQRFATLSDAIYETGQSLNSEEPISAMIYFGLDSEDMLRAWTDKGTYPSAFVGMATAEYLKLWSELLGTGVAYTQSQGEDAAETATMITATPQQFKGMAMTAVSGVGNAVFEAASQLLNGKMPLQSGQTIEVGGSQTITNENLSQYAAQAQGTGLIYSEADSTQIRALFEQ